MHIPIEEIEVRADELNADDEIVVCHQGVRSAAVAVTCVSAASRT